MSDGPYRATAPRAPDAYLVAWADLGRRRRSSLVSLAVSATIGVLLVATPFVAGPAGLLAVLPAMVAWRALWRADRRADKFLCPACGNRFSALASGFHNDFTRHCLHCGIEVGTRKEPT